MGAVSTFAVIAFVTWLGTRIGKRHAFFVSTGVSIVGYGLKWVCYNPDLPWLVLLPAPLMAFGLGGLFTLMPSMIADVVDVDELETHERREGMFGSIFWWMVKLGMAAALAGGGYLLNATGFDVALGGAQADRTIILMRLCDAVIPMVTSAIAIWAVATFPITEEKAHEVRQELERRRGKPGEPERRTGVAPARPIRQPRERQPEPAGKQRIVSRVAHVEVVRRAPGPGERQPALEVVVPEQDVGDALPLRSPGSQAATKADAGSSSRLTTSGRPETRTVTTGIPSAAIVRIVARSSGCSEASSSVSP